MSGLIERIPARFWGLASLVLVALAWLALFRYDNYGIDEGAARALLLNWAIADQIAHPVALVGAPDLRAFLFAILDIHWAGDLIAAKVLGLFAMLGVGLALHDWAGKRLGAEVALIGTGLTLIAPITVMQVDSIGKGPWMLLAFWAGCVFESRYHDSRRDIPGDYFLTLIFAALAVSLHPAGLALPAAIAWKRWRQAKEKKTRNLFIGLGLVAILFPLIRWGWPELNWLGNPLEPLGTIFTGPSVHPENEGSGAGLLALGLLALTVLFSLRRLGDSVFSLALVLGAAAGALAPDGGWALVSQTLMLYFGADLLIRLNRRLRWRPGLAGERGLVVLGIMAVATTFTMADRRMHYVARHDILGKSDMVIHRLCAEAADPDQPFRAASQWPGRAMLACKRAVFPLPAPAKLAMAVHDRNHGLTHLAFDYRSRRQHDLARQAALLSAELETIAVLPGGVVLRARNFSPKQSSAPKPASGKQP